ncbi:MAG: hypothetical protein LBE74_04950 [Treponema sp.]|jgi:hypothetical protein|nr:hypothetical protein [Treponema sp.]
MKNVFFVVFFLLFLCSAFAETEIKEFFDEVFQFGVDINNLTPANRSEFYETTAKKILGEKISGVKPESRTKGMPIVSFLDVVVNDLSSKQWDKIKKMQGFEEFIKSFQLTMPRSPNTKDLDKKYDDSYKRWHTAVTEKEYSIVKAVWDDIKAFLVRDDSKNRTAFYSALDGKGDYKKLLQEELGNRKERYNERYNDWLASADKKVKAAGKAKDYDEFVRKYNELKDYKNKEYAELIESAEPKLAEFVNKYKDRKSDPSVNEVFLALFKAADKSFEELDKDIGKKPEFNESAEEKDIKDKCWEVARTEDAYLEMEKTLLRYVYAGIYKKIDKKIYEEIKEQKKNDEERKSQKGGE